MRQKNNCQSTESVCLFSYQDSYNFNLTSAAQGAINYSTIYNIQKVLPGNEKLTATDMAVFADVVSCLPMFLSTPEYGAWQMLYLIMRNLLEYHL